ALPDLTEQEKVSTSTQLDPVRVDAGQTIFNEGDKADNFYIVTEGEVEVVRGGDGSEQKIATLGPGQFFGEMGLLSGRPRMATVRATKETHLMALDASEFGNLMNRSSGGAADVAYEVKMRTSEPSTTPAAPAST
ncbi:MAG: cyclic nucleotide-binding domain-containing protein, partial [Actinomycetota bacterium]